MGLYMDRKKAEKWVAKLGIKVSKVKKISGQPRGVLSMRQRVFFS